MCAKSVVCLWQSCSGNLTLKMSKCHPLFMSNMCTNFDVETETLFGQYCVTESTNNTLMGPFKTHEAIFQWINEE